MRRLGYLGLAAVAAAGLYAAVVAAFIGLLPPALLGALGALVLGLFALVGAAAPGAVARRPALRRAMAAGGGLLTTAVAWTVGWGVWHQRRPLVLVARPPAPRRVRVVYEVSDGAPRRLAWSRRLDVPASGLVHTQYARDYGIFTPGNPHPVRAVIPPGPRASAPAATWVAGGSTEAAGCRFAYDDYVLGPLAPADTVDAESLLAAGALDSLGRLGVACRGGRLYRAAGAPSPRPTAPACYSRRDGGITCRLAPAQAPAPGVR